MLAKWIRFPLLIVALSSSALAIVLTQQTKVNAQSSGTRCGIGAPPGFVATSYFYQANCPKLFGDLNPNATRFTRPRSGLTKCGTSAVPGFIVTRVLFSRNCIVDRFRPGQAPNAAVIQAGSVGPLAARRVGRSIRVSNCNIGVEGRARRSAGQGQGPGPWSVWLKLSTLPDWRVAGITCDWIPTPPGQLGVADLEWRDPSDGRSTSLYLQQL